MALMPNDPAEAAAQYQPDLPVVSEKVTIDLPSLAVVKGLSIHDREFHQLTAGENLAEALMRISPDRWGNSGISLFRNCLKAENKVDLMSVPDITVAKGDLFIIYAGPADPISAGVLAAALLGGAAFLTAGVAAGLIVGGLVLAGVLVGTFLFQPPNIKTPETNSDVGAGQGTLGIPQNRARLGSRIPEIYGYVRTWPDLITPPIDVYAGKSYSLDIYYCIGVGDYDFANPQFGDVSITKFPGTTWRVINPEMVPFTHGLLRETPEAKGFQLSPINTWSPWVRLPGRDMTEIWVDFAFPGGLVKYSSSDGDVGAQTARGEIEYRRVFTSGSVSGVTMVPWEFTARTNGQLRWTYRIPTGVAGEWEVRTRKTSFTTSADDLHVHDCEIARFASFKNVAVAHNRFARRRTYVQVVVNSHRNADAQNYDDFNLNVSRFMPVLETTGIATYQPTQRWCDALVDMLLDPYCGGYAFNEIDVPAMLGIQSRCQAIDSGQGGGFNWIYDRFMDVDEQLQSCADAVRAACVHDFGRVTFIRDERRTARTALLTDRNRVEGDEGGRTLSFPTPDEPDGVEIEWFDVSNKYIKRTYRYPDDIQLFNPRKIATIGLMWWSQVYRRAYFEYQKQRKRRRTNTITTMEEGLLLMPMDLVEIVEPYLGSRVQGDIIGYQNHPTLGVFVDVEPAVTLSANDQLAVTSNDGREVDIIPIRDTAVETPVTRLFLTRPPTLSLESFSNTSFPLAGSIQAPSRFYVGSVGEHTRNIWLVSNVKPQDNRVTIQFVEYDDTIYNADTIGLKANPPITT